MLLFYVTLSAVFFTASGFPFERETATKSRPLCEWRGTGPICSGSCKSYEKEVRQYSLAPEGEEELFGSMCVVGKKTLCCLRSAFEGKWGSTYVHSGSLFTCETQHPSTASKRIRKCGVIQCTKEYYNEQVSESAEIYGNDCNRVRIFGQELTAFSERIVSKKINFNGLVFEEDVWYKL